MKVVFNALQAGNRSGTGRYTVELLRAMAALEGPPEMVVAWPRDVFRAEHRFAAVARSRSAGARLFFDQVGIRALVRRTGADICHYPASVGPAIPPAPIVATVHDLGFRHEFAWHRGTHGLYYRLAVARTLQVSRRIIAVSHFTSRDIQELAGVSEDRIDVIHNGISEAFRPAPETACAAVREKYRLPERFFLFVGTLEPRKNLTRVLEAWLSIAESVEEDLVLAGRIGWKQHPLLARVERSSLSSRIHLPGHVAQEELPALYTAARAFVWPSLFEGFGFPPVEAMACGTPVLTSNTSSLPELCGDAALLVDPKSTEAIATGMTELAGDEELRGRLRQRGLGRAQNFSWVRCAELTVTSYRRAIGG